MESGATLRLETPLGHLLITGTEDALTGIMFGTSRRTSSRVPAPLRDCARQLREYFAGTRLRFTDLPLAIAEDGFRSHVWRRLTDIPFGRVMTYGGVAQEVGNPAAVRAVGSACRSNPFIIVIPCHRVVPASLQLGSYAAGVQRKQWLLDHEQEVMTAKWAGIA